MFGLTGFVNFIVTFIVVLLILLPTIWLILPFIFRFLVARYFDGSYDYKKDTIKTEKPYPPQKNEYLLHADKENMTYSVSFGEGRNLTEGQVEVHFDGKIYASYDVSELDPEKYKSLKLFDESEEEIETDLGKAVKTCWKWLIPTTSYTFRTSFIQLKDESRKNILIFESSTETGIEKTSSDDYDIPVLNFPIFRNESPNKRIFTYKDLVFCPGTQDFDFAVAPVCFFDDDKNTVIVSPLDNYTTNGIQKRKVKGLNAFRFACGPNGEVDSVPKDHSHRYIMIFDQGINDSFKYWGDTLLEYNGVNREEKDRYREDDLKYLGYYTDNGAYYYYKPIKGLGYDGTLLEVKEYADSEGIPFKYYHLDSWWYQKSVKKMVRTLLGPLGRLVGGGLYGGTLLWEPDPLVFQMEADEDKSIVEKLSDEFGGLPFTAHNRWYSDKSPYVEKYNFHVEGTGAMPKDDPKFWDEIMENCDKYNISTYEQDWLKTHMSRFSFLRSELGAAHIWLKNMAEAADKRDIGVQYCMANPGIIMESTNFRPVITARASGDYNARWPKRYDTPYFLQSSMLMYSVGLWPFKDTFQSTSTGPISGERHPQLMGLLSNLSASMVAPGDKIGMVNKDIVNSVCRNDGFLYKPDRPITACDITYIRNRKYYLARTVSNHGDLTWHYTLALNLWPRRVKDTQYTIEDMDFSGEFVRYNWFTNETQKVNSCTPVAQDLKYEEYVYEVFAPILDNGMAIIGDPSKYVTMNDTEFSDPKERSGKLMVTVNNIEDEVSELLVYTENDPKKITLDEVELDQSEKIEESRYFFDSKSNLLHIWMVFDEDGSKELIIK